MGKDEEEEIIPEKAILAGGCFWGMEELFRKFPDVISTRVGYTGGRTDDPTYESVSTGTTNHTEAIEVSFNPKKLSYRKLLEFFFQIHDPTTRNKQGNDQGTQYRSAIFTLSDEQTKIAKELIGAMRESKKWPGPIVTQVTPATTFYPAEAVHQKYLMHLPEGYNCHFVRPDWKL
jgi:peptide-methionine (S)-S-oxide reductase